MDIAMIGATGLIGTALRGVLDQAEDVDRVICYVRKIPNEALISEKIEYIETAFSEDKIRDLDIKADVLVNCLGTTIKQAGTQERFREIDLGIPLVFSRRALECGVDTMINLSSVGASSGSRNFYLRTKGELEQALDQLGFERICHLRPSLLLGDRKEQRAGEGMASLIMKPLAPLIPALWRPIRDQKLAEAMLRFIRHGSTGRTLLQGTSLF